eukprot:TRINITY_DN116_c0_g1_i1.p1 TRINITY_DN116_c0_g1~~TRINITY_DN116_c0_g1_i1.p1  ORF type:complete len:367 (-),score=58.67 TRINITY_DN116_c0_g1_i1:52-1152(-)
MSKNRVTFGGSNVGSLFVVVYPTAYSTLQLEQVKHSRRFFCLFDLIPSEILYKISSYFDIRAIASFQLTNRRFFNFTQSDDLLWSDALLHTPQAIIALQTALYFQWARSYRSTSFVYCRPCPPIDDLSFHYCRRFSDLLWEEGYKNHDCVEFNSFQHLSKFILKESCPGCGLIPIQNSFIEEEGEREFMWHPILKRSICDKCKNADQYRLISVVELKREFSVLGHALWQERLEKVRGVEVRGRNGKRTTVFLLKDLDEIAKLCLVGDLDKQKEVQEQLAKRRKKEKEIKREKARCKKEVVEATLRVTISCGGVNKVVTLQERTMKEMQKKVWEKFKKRGREMWVGTTQLTEEYLQQAKNGETFLIK